MLRFASLGSGSKGNATVIESSNTRVLLDCGFSTIQTEKRLAVLECPPESLDAIIVTHEHGDHSGGVAKLSRKYKVPVWITVGTSLACKDNNFSAVQYIDPHKPFRIDDLEINPFPVPHDAREPCQFVFSDGKVKLGVLTDVGKSTSHIINMLSGVHALLLECNYDAEMLAMGEYPQMLKNRVGGIYGHLDNRETKKILEQMDTSKLKYLIGMHLSDKNNKPELAMAVLRSGIGDSEVEVILANQESGFNWKLI